MRVRVFLMVGLAAASMLFAMGSMKEASAVGMDGYEKPTTFQLIR